MDILTKSDATIIDKTRDLCSTIVAEPGFPKFISDIELFENNTEAQREYNDLLNLQDQLQTKQQSGTALTPQDIEEFEAKRDALLNNEVAAGFLDAQQQIQKVQQTVLQYVNKTFELGRVPEDSELSSGGCCGGGGGDGGGCGGGCSC